LQYHISDSLVLQMKEDEINEDLKDVMATEKARGRRPANREERRKKQKLASDVLWALKSGSTHEFSEQLKLAGISEGSAEWERAWKIFYSSQR